MRSSLTTPRTRAFVPTRSCFRHSAEHVIETIASSKAGVSKLHAIQRTIGSVLTWAQALFGTKFARSDHRAHDAENNEIDSDEYASDDSQHEYIDIDASPQRVSSERETDAATPRVSVNARQ
jgi:hypothetical protein